MEFVDNFEGPNKLHIVFGSLIPSSKTESICDDNFKLCDNIVQSYIKDISAASYLNLYPILRFDEKICQDDTGLDRTLSDIKLHLFRDGIHLNSMATRWLAEHICGFMKRLPTEIV